MDECGGWLLYSAVLIVGCKFSVLGDTECTARQLRVQGHYKIETKSLQLVTARQLLFTLRAHVLRYKTCQNSETNAPNDYYEANSSNYFFDWGKLEEKRTARKTQNNTYREINYYLPNSRATQITKCLKIWDAKDLQTCLHLITEGFRFTFTANGNWREFVPRDQVFF